jgi:hypothetical protein
MKYFFYCITRHGLRNGFLIWKSCRYLSKYPGRAQNLVVALRQEGNNALLRGQDDLHEILEEFADDIQKWLHSLDHPGIKQPYRMPSYVDSLNITSRETK